MKRKKYNIRLILLCVGLTVWILLDWVWMFHTTQLATSNNTYQLQEQIQEIKIRLAHHRGNDKLYIFTPNDCYMLELVGKNENRTTELAKHIMDSKEAVTMTVWEHFPKYFFDSSNIVKVRQVVDLRNDNEIYWNIERHNNYQQRERVAGITASTCFLILIVAFDCLVCYVIVRQCKCSKKNFLRKYKRQGTICVNPKEKQRRKMRKTSNGNPSA